MLVQGQDGMAGTGRGHIALLGQCLADAEKGKFESIPTLKWKLAMFIGDHGPKGLPRLVSRKLVGSRKKR